MSACPCRESWYAVTALAEPNVRNPQQCPEADTAWRGRTGCNFALKRMAASHKRKPTGIPVPEPRRGRVLATKSSKEHHIVTGSSSLKGILLAGGTGSRLHPLTRITNKHLLPIYDRPMVNYAIQALVTAGIEDIMLVTGGMHAGVFLRLLGNGHDHGVARLSYAYQEKAGGIAEALGLAARFADGSPVVVMLADNIFEFSIAPAVAEFAAQPTGSRVLLARMEDEVHLQHLGVAEMDPGKRISRIIEKPTTPPTPYAVTGVYCYDSTVFDFIPTLRPSARGELEITDVNNYYVAQGTLEYNIIEGFWGDAGESISAYYDVNDFVRAHGANKPAKKD